MAESKISAEKESKTNWVIWLVVGSVVPILLIVLGVIEVWTLETTAGLVDTTTEHAVFFIGRFVGFPYGLLNMIVLGRALKKGLRKKGLAIAGIIIGLLNLLVGLLMWIVYFMVMAFAAAF